MNNELLIQALHLCADMFGAVGASTFQKKVEEFADIPTESALDDILGEVALWADFEESKKKKMFTFSGGNLMMIRFYIFSVEKEWNEQDKPILIINKMPDDMTLKENPYKNVHIIYDNDENRDRDFDRLQMLIK